MPTKANQNGSGSADLWEVCASPVRAEILSLFEAMGRATVRELAEAMDRPADGLYHHVHRLEAVGIIEEHGRRPAIRGSEVVYAYRPERFLPNVGPEHADKIVRFTQAMVGGIIRSAGSAIAAGVARFRSQNDTNTTLRFETAKLTDAERARVVEHITGVVEIFDAARARTVEGSDTDAELHSVAMILTPAMRERKHRRERESSTQTTRGRTRSDAARG